jgi:L-lactate dehydrogenase complex protein LldF
MASEAFEARARDALGDPSLQTALERLRTALALTSASAAERLPEFEALREQGRRIRDRTLAHLDFYLERFEERVVRSGGEVHWARDAAEARAAILAICRRRGATRVTKGKSMVSEEIELNGFLEANGIRTLETDLGEYIIQLIGDRPSHIIAPAIHVPKEEVDHVFAVHHGRPESVTDASAQALMSEARHVLRRGFLEAEVGITGANFCVAESGTTVIVTNEGNGDLTQTLPPVHIVLTSIEKMVPTLEDASTLLRLLARSATGQEITVYTTFSTGPKRSGDVDGPEEFHVVLVDNGRSELVGSDLQDMLRCIRCSACLNHCPVYGAIGGHAYDSVYSGPMGAVLTPHLQGLARARDLPNASTFCGQCESVCPVKIPLPRLMRHWREREFEQHLKPRAERLGLGVWSWLARRPRLYGLVARAGARLLRGISRDGRIRRLPLGRSWTAWRDLPAPEGRTFTEQWHQRGDAHLR